MLWCCVSAEVASICTEVSGQFRSEEQQSGRCSAAAGGESRKNCGHDQVIIEKMNILFCLCLFVCLQKVVQRLFDDQEEDLDTNVTEEVSDSQKEQLTCRASGVRNTKFGLITVVYLVRDQKHSLKMLRFKTAFLLLFI